MEAIVLVIALMPSMTFIYWGVLAWKEIKILDSRIRVGSPTEAATAAKSLVIFGVVGCLLTVGYWLGIT